MNRQPCRRHCYIDGPCILCAAPAHMGCFQDVHGGCWGGWQVAEWWR